MIKILKIKDTIFENFPKKTIIPTEYDENGNPTKFEERYTFNLSLNELKEAVKDTMLWLEKQRLNQIFSKYGYSSLSDVMLYANKQGDTNQAEAQAILDWYTRYDTKVWNFIETLSGYTDIDSLYTLDIRQTEEEIFNQTKATLPPE